MAGVRYHRRLTIDDQIRERYLHVPFDVPPGTSTLSVRLRVADAEAVVDLGCVAPRRWCGWAGAARSEFVIGHEQATPGFLPGLEPGTWHVVLGLHLLPPGGTEVELEGVLDEPAEFAAEPLAPVQNQVRGSAREIPAAGGLKWFAGDFHAHTTHSDGSESIDELAARAAAAGLDFLAVTDHNTTSHHRLLPASARRHGITLIPGQEVTTAAGHACAYGDIGWVDFRTPGAQWLEQVERAGGLLSLSHPLEGDCSWQHHLERAPHAVELWHISWYRDLRHTFPWAWWQMFEHLPGSERTALIGGSDFHHPDAGWTLGTPTTWVAARDNTTEALLEGVRAGRTAISVGVRPDATPDPLHAPLLIRHDGDLLALAAQDAVLVDALGHRQRVQTDPAVLPAAGRGPYRLEDAYGRVLAITG